MKTKDVVLIGMMGAIMFTLQVALSSLPNIELVTLLTILFTFIFNKKAVFIIYVFVLLEGLFYGFGIWWFGYLYVWTVLYFITVLFRKVTNPIYWAVISGGFGLGFGALFSIPYFITGGFAGGVAFWVAGIPFDLIHGISNFFLALVLFMPLYKILDTINKHLENRSHHLI